MGIVNGVGGTMNYVDLIIQVIFAGGAIYFLIKEKSASR